MRGVDFLLDSKKPTVFTVGFH